MIARGFTIKAVTRALGLKIAEQSSWGRSWRDEELPPGHSLLREARLKVQDHRNTLKLISLLLEHQDSNPLVNNPH